MVMKSLSLLFLADTLPGYVIALIVGGGVVVLLLAIFLINLLLKRKKKTVFDDSVWIEALGGKENIAYVEAVGSRINLSLKNKELINREKLNELGVKSVLSMSNKVTLVVNNQAVDIANSIRNNLND